MLATLSIGPYYAEVAGWPPTAGEASVMSTTPEAARRMGIAPVAEGKLPVLRGGVSSGPEHIDVQTLIGASQ
jgi:hypothetical protein